MSQTLTHPMESFCDNATRKKTKNIHLTDAFCLSSNENIPGYLRSSSNKSNYEIIWIKDGAGSFTINSQKYHIQKDVVYCLSPFLAKDFQEANVIEGYYISVSEDFVTGVISDHQSSVLQALVNGASNLLILELVKENRAEMEEVLLKMRHEYGKDLSLKMNILTCLFKIFAFYMSRNIDLVKTNNADKRDTELVRNYLRLIRRHIITNKFVAEYAIQLCVTPQYLNRVVKKISGQTASHHIQQVIIQEAKKQFLQPNTTMKQIAYSLGFEDVSHFSKFFKNAAGYNFSTFKKGFPG